jgi:hypothetical protein
MPRMKASHRIFRAAAFAGVVAWAGCTSADIYQAGQQWKQQECRKLLDTAERSRCEKSNAVSYDQYRAQAEARKTPPP